jgi:hypothetical protein
VAGAADTSQISQEKMAQLVAWGERIGEALAEGFLGTLDSATQRAVAITNLIGTDCETALFALIGERMT